MQSKTNPSVIAFPAVELPPPTNADRKAAEEHDAHLAELCGASRLALQELRSGIYNMLRDTLDKMDLDVWTLVRVLDERPSVVQDLIAGETDGLTTETLIGYLEKLRA